MLYYLCFGRYCSRAAGSAALAPTPPGKGVQRQKREFVEEGWKRVRHSKRTKVDQPPPRDTLQQDGWNVRVEHSRGCPPQGGDFLGERERSEGVDDRNAIPWVLGSACAN